MPEENDASVGERLVVAVYQGKVSQVVFYEKATGKVVIQLFQAR